MKKYFYVVKYQLQQLYFTKYSLNIKLAGSLISPMWHSNIMFKLRADFNKYLNADKLR